MRQAWFKIAVIALGKNMNRCITLEKCIGDTFWCDVIHMCVQKCAALWQLRHSSHTQNSCCRASKHIKVVGISFIIMINMTPHYYWTGSQGPLRNQQKCMTHIRMLFKRTSLTQPIKKWQELCGVVTLYKKQTHCITVESATHYNFAKSPLISVRLSHQMKSICPLSSNVCVKNPATYYNRDINLLHLPTCV